MGTTATVRRTATTHEKTTPRRTLVVLTHAFRADLARVELALVHTHVILEATLTRQLFAADLTPPVVRTFEHTNGL